MLSLLSSVNRYCAKVMLFKQTAKIFLLKIFVVTEFLFIFACKSMRACSRLAVDASITALASLGFAAWLGQEPQPCI